MNFLEKFYFKRCSTEVQIMLERMKDRPEDFDYGTGWRTLVEKADDVTCPYTSVERVMIRKYWKECKRVRSRKELLARIMSETINPTTQKDLEDQLRKQYTSNLAASLHNTKHALTSGILTGYNDPRLMYGQIDQTGRIHHPHQGIQP